MYTIHYGWHTNPVAACRWCVRCKTHTAHACRCEQQTSKSPQASSTHRRGSRTVLCMQRQGVCRIYFLSALRTPRTPTTESRSPLAANCEGALQQSAEDGVLRTSATAHRPRPPPTCRCAAAAAAADMLADAPRAVLTCNVCICSYKEEGQLQRHFTPHK